MISQLAGRRIHQRRSQGEGHYVGRPQTWTPDDDDRQWLREQIASVTHQVEQLKPSEWTEKNRYLPRTVSTMPGRYRFDVTPYFKEILDCLDPRSPVRRVALMKGVQVGATVGILENGLGYAIAHLRNAPCMLVTADKELAKLRMDAYIVPMLEHSGLAHLIQSQDTFSGNRKTGKTDLRVEWDGGGFLVPQGAKNADKQRQNSYMIVWLDEMDTFPLNVGKQGDPVKLCIDRTAAYEETRKIFGMSTPKETDTSQIAKMHKDGDQRKYFVRCLRCNTQQTLAWKRTDNDTGVVSGFDWKVDERFNLVTGSVRYVCKECGHQHHNHDKAKLLSPKYGAEWKPTAIPVDPSLRSYHLSAFYSQLQTWETLVRGWLEAWDVEHDQPKDIYKLQVFYNNTLGIPFRQHGESVMFKRASAHRRKYSMGEVPNELAKGHSGGPILLVTCAVDVHKNDLAVAMFGWCRGRRCWLLDYDRWEGDTEQLDDPGTWERLREMLDTKVYTADDGASYRPTITLIDSGYRTAQVYSFCAPYQAGVYPIKGQATPPKSARHKEFSEFSTPMGTRAFGITVDVYKDRWKGALNRDWDQLSVQPLTFFNAPQDVTDKQLRELTVESKREMVHSVTGKPIGWEWHRPQGAANELWDLLVYSNAAVDLVAWDICRNQFEVDRVDWKEFWTLVEERGLFRQ